MRKGRFSEEQIIKVLKEHQQSGGLQALGHSTVRQWRRKRQEPQWQR